MKYASLWVVVALLRYGYSLSSLSQLSRAMPNSYKEHPSQQESRVYTVLLFTHLEEDGLSDVLRPLGGVLDELRRKVLGTLQIRL